MNLPYKTVCLQISLFCYIELFAGLAIAGGSLTEIPIAVGGKLGNGVTLTGVSLDGSIVVGTAGSSPSQYAYRWTQAGGIQSLGTLNGGTYSQASGVSGDGLTVVGVAPDGASGSVYLRAFRWTQAGGMVSLGALNGGTDSWGTGINADGSVIVGYAHDGSAGNAYRAFRWTQSGGMQSLGILSGGTLSSANGVSGDGTVVVGYADDASTNTFAFRWTQTGGMQSLGALTGALTSTATGTNSDGSVVVGYSFFATVVGGKAVLTNTAFQWTSSAGMQSLGMLNGGNSSSAYGISADGLVIVGQANDGAASNTPRAFRWTQSTGLQSVDQWLASNGVSMSSGLTTYSASATNKDGSVVVGLLSNGDGFIARVSSTGNGLVTLSDLSTSLSGDVAAPTIVLNYEDMLMHGAHGNPLAHRVTNGDSCVWGAGDWGRDDHGGRNGNAGLAEIGGCHRINGDLQLNVALGQQWGRQNTVYSGYLNLDGNYLMLEGLGKIPNTSMWPSMAILYGDSNASILRGYLNAGLPDASSASTKVQTWALRARLDWDSIAHVGSNSISPYIDLTQSRSRIDAYTEFGGGFPAFFNGRTETATESRLGAHGAMPIDGDIRLTSDLEEVHRFEGAGANASGQVLGLFAFNLPGATVKKDWMRAGLGMESKLGKGTASAMLNATTQGQDPSYWLAVAWQVGF